MDNRKSACMIFCVFLLEYFCGPIVGIKSLKFPNFRLFHRLFRLLTRNYYFLSHDCTKINNFYALICQTKSKAVYYRQQFSPEHVCQLIIFYFSINNLIYWVALYIEYLHFSNFPIPQQQCYLLYFEFIVFTILIFRIFPNSARGNP